MALNPKDDCPYGAATKKIWIPITEFQGAGAYDNLTVDSGSTAVTSTAANGDVIGGVAGIGSSGTGNPGFQEVGTTGLVALKMDAAGDDIGHLWMIPTDMDVTAALNFYVKWSSDQTTDTDTFTWKIMHKEIELDVTAPGTPSTVLDTIIAADTNIGTADAIQLTAAGVLNGGTLTAGRDLQFLVELQAVSGADPASDDVNLYGVVMEYVQTNFS